MLDAVRKTHHKLNSNSKQRTGEDVVSFLAQFFPDSGLSPDSLAAADEANDAKNPQHWSRTDTGFRSGFTKRGADVGTRSGFLDVKWSGPATSGTGGK